MNGTAASVNPAVRWTPVPDKIEMHHSGKLVQYMSGHIGKIGRVMGTYFEVHNTHGSLYTFSVEKNSPYWPYDGVITHLGDPLLVAAPAAAPAAAPVTQFRRCYGEQIDPAWLGRKVRLRNGRTGTLRDSVVIYTDYQVCDGLGPISTGYSKGYICGSLGVDEDILEVEIVPVSSSGLLKFSPLEWIDESPYQSCSEGHSPVDTGMRRSWCGRCDCDMELSADGTYTAVLRN